MEQLVQDISTWALGISKGRASAVSLVLVTLLVKRFFLMSKLIDPFSGCTEKPCCCGGGPSAGLTGREERSGLGVSCLKRNCLGTAREGSWHCCGAQV